MATTSERQDVATAYGLTTNRFGYSWSYPTSYRTGQPLTVTVRYAGTMTELSSSPRLTPGCSAGARVGSSLDREELIEAIPEQVVVYPNPATTELAVKHLPEPVAAYRFLWVNLLGQASELFPLLTGEVNVARFYIGNQPPGIYVLRMIQDGKQPIAVTILKK